jgi:hypothetical protein
MKYLFVFIAIITLGCGSDTAFECELGNLHGVWKIAYHDIHGTCGYLYSEVIEFKPGQILLECSGSRELSPDACLLTLDVTCPTEDNRGNIRTIWDIEQTTTITLKGSVWIDIEHSTESCSGLYAVDITRIKED